MPSLTIALTQTPLHATSVAWREQEMGKPVRAASSGISGRRNCSVMGEGMEHSTLVSPSPPFTAPVPGS